MGDFRGAPAVHLNFPLQSFSLYLTFKSGIAASGEPILFEEGMIGERDGFQLLALSILWKLRTSILGVNSTNVCTLTM